MTADYFWKIPNEPEKHENILQQLEKTILSWHKFEEEWNCTGTWFKTWFMNTMKCLEFGKMDQKYFFFVEKTWSEKKSGLQFWNQLWKVQKVGSQISINFLNFFSVPVLLLHVIIENFIFIIWFTHRPWEIIPIEFQKNFYKYLIFEKWKNFTLVKEGMYLLKIIYL